MTNRALWLATKEGDNVVSVVADPVTTRRIRRLLEGRGWIQVSEKEGRKLLRLIG